MARKRVSPTLLTDGISLVKGEKFKSWRTVGSVVAAAEVFSMRDVDELVLLDVRATLEDRSISLDLVRSVAQCLTVPLIVGGGVKTIVDFEEVLRAGADKVVLGTEGFRQPELIARCADVFGSQAVMVSVDASSTSNNVSILSGSTLTNQDVVEFSIKCVELGAGELILQNVDRDGCMNGMDLGLIGAVSKAVDVPITASGGARNYQDLLEAFHAGAEAVSAGAMFQFTEQTPRGARNYLHANNVDVRIAE